LIGTAGSGLRPASAGILILEDNGCVCRAAADWTWPLDGAWYADIRTRDERVRFSRRRAVFAWPNPYLDEGEIR